MKKILIISLFACCMATQSAQAFRPFFISQYERTLCDMLDRAESTVVDVENDSMVRTFSLTPYTFECYCNTHFITSYPLVSARNWALELVNKLETAEYSLNLINSERPNYWLLSESQRLQTRISLARQTIQSKINLIDLNRNYQAQLNLYNAYHSIPVVQPAKNLLTGIIEALLQPSSKDYSYEKAKLRLKEKEIELKIKEIEQQKKEPVYSYVYTTKPKMVTEGTQTDNNQSTQTEPVQKPKYTIDRSQQVNTQTADFSC